MTTLIPQTKDGQPDELHRIKKTIENSYQGFRKNYDNFTKSQKFVFVTSMDENSESVNEELNRPSLEFNVIEAKISRFCGEFAKNEPGIIISASDDFQARNPEQNIDMGELIKVLEGHLRHIRHESNKMGTDYHVYRDQLSGGFSGLKIVAEYADNRSFKQVIKLKKTFDPILTGYDPLAMNPDKSDGEYCFEIFPMRKHDFEKQFPNVDIQTVRYVKSLGDFQWSYMIGKEEVILVADYYEKKKKKTKLYELANGQVMTKKEYKKFIEEWDAKVLRMEEVGLAPIIMNERETDEITIVRYQVIENQIIGEEDTDYTDLPLKFVDGNSILRKDDLGGHTYQFTRPFIYQAMGAQMLLNFAGQCLAHELQDMRPAQIIASLESIPEQYIDGYRDPKALASVIYNEFYDGDPNVRVTRPEFAPRFPIPQEIMNTFQSMPVFINNSLGIADDVMSKDRSRDLSGKAMDAGIELANSVVVPYLYNHDLAFESAAQMIIDMMPLYYNTPRTLPVISEDGKRGAANINGESGLQIRYKPGDLRVKIEAGINFTQQQRQAVNQITSLMQIPAVGDFVGKEALDIVFDNVPFRGSETFKGRYAIWSENMKKMQQQAMMQESQKPKMEEMGMQLKAQQLQMENQVAMAKLEIEANENKAKTAIEVAKLELEKQRLQVELAKLTSQMHVEEQKLGIEQRRADDERVERVIDSAIKQNEHAHGLADKEFGRALSIVESDRAHEREKAKAFEGKETPAEERLEEEERA